MSYTKEDTKTILDKIRQHLDTVEGLSSDSINVKDLNACIVACTHAGVDLEHLAQTLCERRVSVRAVTK